MVTISPHLNQLQTFYSPLFFRQSIGLVHSFFRASAGVTYDCVTYDCVTGVTQMVGDGVKLPQNNMNIDYSPTTITAVAATTTGLTPIHTTGAFAPP